MDYPLDYLDKLCLAGTCRDHATSAAPVWQLYIEGDLRPRVLARALARLVRRYPVLASHVAAADSREDWDTARRLVYRVDQHPDLNRMLHLVDLRGAACGAFRDLQRSLFDHHMDLTRDYPLQLTWARTGADSGVLFVQQHHGIADGLAFFELLDDLCTLYDQAEVEDPGEASLSGLDLLAPSAPMLRIPEAEMIEPRRWRRPWQALLGFGHHLRRLARLVLSPVDQLYCNRWSDRPGRNDVLHYHLDDAVLDVFREIKQRNGFSANDLLTAALGLALARWSADHDAPVRRYNVLSPADMRPRHDPPRSFANHLSSYLVDFDLERMPDARSMLDAVHRQVRQQALAREPHKKLLAENSVARFFPVRWIHKAIYRARRTPLNYSFSNLISISPKHHGGKLGTRSWTASHLRILTPNAYLNGTNTTVIRYAGKLCFNFNFKDGVIPRAHVGQLIEHFGGALAEVVVAARKEDLLPAPIEVSA